MDAIRAHIKQKTKDGYINIQPVISSEFNTLDLLATQYQIHGESYPTCSLVFCGYNEVELLFPDDMETGVEHTLIFLANRNLQLQLPKFNGKFLAHSESSTYELKGYSVIKYFATPPVSTEHFKRIFFYVHPNMVSIQ